MAGIWAGWLVGMRNPSSGKFTEFNMMRITKLRYYLCSIFLLRKCEIIMKFRSK